MQLPSPGTNLIASLLLMFGVSAQASFDRVDFVGQEGNTVLLKADRGLVRVSVLTPDILRVQATGQDKFASSLMVDSGFVRVDWPETPFEVKDSDESVMVAASGFKLRVTKAPFALEILSAAGKPLLTTVGKGGVGVDEGTALKLEMTPADHFFGFGYMRKCFDARGHTLTWTRTYRNNEATVPFFLNPRGYAFFSNNTWKNDFDFTADDTFKITTAGGDLDFFVMVGADFKTLLSHYTDLTGKPQMVPKWSLGLEHRARYYDNAEDLLKTARTFRERNIPCEIMALEPGWEAKPYSMEWRWSPKRFPDYRETIQELKSMGYKFDLWESGAAPKMNILDPEVRRQWFARRAAALTNWGVDMFKQDDPYPRGIKSVGMEAMEKSEGEVEDRNYHSDEIITVANSFYTETAFEEWRGLTGRRPVIQFHAYNASVASQRWPYQWGGDFGTGWGLYNASLSGHPMANADARSPYLDARHIDFFMSAGPVNDCWAYCIEPWNYPDRLLEGCRMYASLRARLYPYFYTALRDAHETGTPIMRPMVLVNPQDPETYRIGSQFFIGDSLLVATSVELDQYGDHARMNIPEEIPDAATRTTPVYLTQGTWIDYWTGREYRVAKNRWVDCAFPSYAGGPLFVKAGAIVPMAQVKHHTEEWKDELLTLDVYPAETRQTHRLYEDDGITFEYEDGRFANTTFAVVGDGAAITIDLGKRQGEYDGKPARRDYLLKVYSSLAPSKVMVDGKKLRPQSKDKILFSSRHSGWYYDAEASKIIIKPRSGWQYVRSDENPAGTYPLTPGEESVVFEQTKDHSATSSRIEITLDPDLKQRLGRPTRIMFQPENPRLLADGRSSVKIGVMICDENGNVVESADQTVDLKLKGGGRMAETVDIAEGRGEVVFTAPSSPGKSELSASSGRLSSESLELHALKGKLEMVVNPNKKVALPGKGEWLARHFTIAVSARDDKGNRIASQLPVKLVIRDYKDRETINRQTDMIDGEAEFRNVAYKTRPEKFIITASAEGLEPVTFKAFENAWHLPDDYLDNKEIKKGLEQVLDH